MDVNPFIIMTIIVLMKATSFSIVAHFMSQPAAMLFAALITVHALAATATITVVISYGDWLAQLATIGVSVAGSLIAWAVRRLPARYLALLQMIHTDQILGNGVNYGLNAVAGVARGKTLTVDVGNAVVQQAVTYVLTHAPQWLVTWLGGEAAITQKIIARLSIDETVGVQVTGNSAVLVPAT